MSWRVLPRAFAYVESQDVALALNVFHHFIKIQQTHEALRRLLARPNVDITVFEAHKLAAAQMKYANVNYEPDDLAAFVAEKARLSSITPLSRRRGHRVLYKLAK